LAEQERLVLQQSLSDVQRDAKAAELESDRQIQDLLSRIDQYRTTVDGLRTELNDIT